jgi:hypothetical protein
MWWYSIQKKGNTWIVDKLYLFQMHSFFFAVWDDSEPECVLPLKYKGVIQNVSKKWNKMQQGGNDNRELIQSFKGFISNDNTSI